MFLACLTLGVGAIAAVGVINAGVIEGLKRDAAALLGGDIQIEASNLPLAEDELAALMPPGARARMTVRTNAMAQGSDGRRVVGGAQGGRRRLSLVRPGGARSRRA